MKIKIRNLTKFFFLKNLVQITRPKPPKLYNDENRLKHQFLRDICPGFLHKLIEQAFHECSTNLLIVKVNGLK